MGKNKRNKVLQFKNLGYISISIILIIIGAYIFISHLYYSHFAEISTNWPAVEIIEYKVDVSYAQPGYDFSGRNIIRKGIYIHKITYLNCKQEEHIVKLGLLVSKIDLSTLRCNPNTGKLYIVDSGRRKSKISYSVGSIIMLIGIIFIIDFKLRKLKLLL